MIVSALFLLIVFTWATDSYADKIILKNGREINSDRVWEEKGMIKAVVYGETVAYPKSSVLQVIIEEKEKIATDSFQYDLWSGGMRIEDVMEIAERNNIPIHRSGLISANKNFDPRVSRKYMYSATEFEYPDKLLGKDAKVIFYFTPTSGILYKLEVRLLGTGVNRKSDYRYEVQDILTKKYGSPRNSKNEIMYEILTWAIKDNCLVTMRAGSNSVIILYSDERLDAGKQKEEQKNKSVRMREYRRKDESKF
jgi:hypothetical protein